MLKKITIFILSVSMILCLSACGSNDTSSTPTASPNSTTQSSEESQTQNSVEENLNNTETSAVISATQPSNSQTSNNNTSSPPQTIPIHNHSYSNATCTSPKKCSCGATAGTALGHIFSSATCTSPQICSRCGATNGSALGHSYSNATCTSPKTCSRCGNTEGSALGHNYVNNKCNRCGKIDPESLPVGLETLPVIDSNNNYYSFRNETIKDSFGNSYVGYHCFKEVVNTAYAVFNLDYKYSKFSADIITDSDDATFSIYVDNVLKYQTNINKLSGPVHFEVDVKNGQQLKIVATENVYSWDVAGYLVNAQLSK